MLAIDLTSTAGRVGPKFTKKRTVAPFAIKSGKKYQHMLVKNRGMKSSKRKSMISSHLESDLEMMSNKSRNCRRHKMTKTV